MRTPAEAAAEKVEASSRDDAKVRGFDGLFATIFAVVVLLMIVAGLLSGAGVIR